MILCVNVDATRHGHQQPLEAYTLENQLEVDNFIDNVVLGDEHYVRCLYVQAFTTKPNTEDGYQDYWTATHKFEQGYGGDTSGLDAFRNFAKEFFKTQPIKKEQAYTEIISRMRQSNYDSGTITKALLHLDNHEPTPQRVAVLTSGAEPKDVERRIRAEKAEQEKEQDGHPTDS